MKTIPQFLIAAPTSGSGKTMVSVALIDSFTRHGYKMQAFKCGPDYIDTKFHEKVSKNPSYNLDSFFSSENELRNFYQKHAQDAHVCIVEGMMGLFDGYDRSKGSAAEIASILNLPVVLVVDAKGSGYSFAPLIKGFKEFSPDITIAGVIFNRVDSSKHRRILRQVCDELKISCLGFVSRIREAENKSRYLGLDFSQMKMAEATDRIVEHIHVKRIMKRTYRPISHRSVSKVSSVNSSDTPKVLVAKNKESFSFIYQEHLDKWPNVVFFDPEEDTEIPQDIDLLYLPGGYPERHLEVLSQCGKTMESIRRYAENGGKILAECGGMMYLCNSIINDEKEYPMCGVLPYNITARRLDRRLSLGYRTFTLNGINFKGHEFHYTRFEKPQPESITEVFDASGNKIDSPIIRIGNTIASYTHLYWGNKDIFKIF